mmetsp:Transcript_4991/g.6657  ORF Transcript_4991/g.6657 Transcript_4991/m.6657 type:complete len:118 (+) Transcript_4991:80-433(+)|eukprot:CAMPEP_0185577938 /NCGR_PEP_ID=MMETSP0434-20130131/11526_1 /TAXON_ID=626734 ORGANISM="Favella taraikaensis, Strain Fe Narragansett Bay" /NCGR_SAMPLE_ID=MMETSP0434 /ASSEMBLY_ACC=CAM_ASM_000379 /LENGTH=117 /DNA_ID=CAMNT_0028195637 /DNA_START=20 /DNA_END=373 /DNA_ORIENTATION=+
MFKQVLVLALANFSAATLLEVDAAGFNSLCFQTCRNENDNFKDGRKCFRARKCGTTAFKCLEKGSETALTDEAVLATTPCAQACTAGNEGDDDAIATCIADSDCQKKPCKAAIAEDI